MHQLPSRFVLYRREWDAAAGKWQKRPCDAHGGLINHLDPSRWQSYDAVCGHAHWDDTRSDGAYGVAWVLNGDGWFFLDMDNCRGADGAWTPEAERLFTSFPGCLGEVSTSGNGLHVIGQCQPWMLADRKNRWDGWLECYTEGRLVALSREGLAVIGGGEYQARDWTAQLRAIRPERAVVGEAAWTDEYDPAYTGADWTDEELIERACKSRSMGAAFGDKASFKDLWEARADVLARFYPGSVAGEYDHSGADMALMNMLAFWCGKNPVRMDRLFRMSGLMREKYERRGDYRTTLVSQAVGTCVKVYDHQAVGSTGESNDHTPLTHDQEVLTVTEMVKYFEGCHYDMQDHVVWVPSGQPLKPAVFDAVYGGHDFSLDAEGRRKPVKSAFEAFTQCRSHRFSQVRGTYVEPRDPYFHIDDRGLLNVWRVPQRDSRSGDVGPFMDLLSKLVPDPGDRNVLLHFMASSVQNRGTKFRWGVVMQGMEGNGKSLLADFWTYAVGTDVSHWPNADQIVEKYNSWLVGNVAIVVEEIMVQGRVEVMNSLKTTLTQERIEVRGMAKEKRMERNMANFWFNTNYKDAIIKTATDRRYCVFFTPQQEPGDLEAWGLTNAYFQDLVDWMNRGGRAHVAFFLEHMELDPELDPAQRCLRAPATTSTAEAIAVSRGPYAQVIEDAIEAGRNGFRGGYVSAGQAKIVLEDAGIRRFSTKTLVTAMASLGYKKIGRTSTRLVSEGLTRPIIYSSVGTDPNNYSNFNS